MTETYLEKCFVDMPAVIAYGGREEAPLGMFNPTCRVAL
jgi:hypothetical protein